MNSPSPSLIFFPSNPANTGFPSLWELKTCWTNGQIDGWVSGCPVLPLRVSIGLVLYWNDYHNLFSSHSSLISPNFHLQILKGFCQSRSYAMLQKKKQKKKKVNSLSSVQLFVIPWTVAYQAPQPMGFSRQEYWSELPFPSPGDLLDPGIDQSRQTLYLWATREGRSYFATKKKLFTESGKYHKEHDFPISHDL